jgi:hypothetical protein
VGGTSGFDALGFTFRIAVDDDVMLDGIARPFAALASTDAGEHQYEVVADPSRAGAFAIRLGDEHIGSAIDSADAATVLAHDVTRRALATSACLALHAGGVCSTNGATILLPGDAGAGKTTIVAGLLRQGMEYVTDEAFAVDRDSGDVVPYPKPLSMKAGASALFPELVTAGALPTDGAGWAERQVAPRALGADAARSPGAIAFVVFPRRRAGSTTQLEPLRRAEAVLTVAQQTFAFAARARENLELLAAIVGGATCYRLTIGDLDAAVARLTELVDDARVQESA